MPDANELVVHILIAVAQHELKTIRARTKAALAAAKARGTRLGNPRGLPPRRRRRAPAPRLRPSGHALPSAWNYCARRSRTSRPLGTQR
jgi:DNA invertase Pin-like site-specific DNA recombinase